MYNKNTERTKQMYELKKCSMSSARYYCYKFHVGGGRNFFSRGGNGQRKSLKLCALHKIKETISWQQNPLHPPAVCLKLCKYVKSFLPFWVCFSKQATDNSSS